VDASIWQYGREWVRDHAWIAVGLVLSGQSAKARGLLERLLREFVTERGDTIDSSEQRHPDEVELDQNGELLYALDLYTRWTGDSGIARDHWGRVKALAEFPLQDLFRHSPSGLLANVREYWERHRLYGIEPGMELAYQMFVGLGLASAAGLARLLGRGSEAERWTRESERLRRAVYGEGGFGFIQGGRLFKRRGTDGKICRDIRPLPEAQLPDGSPLAAAGDHFIDPDTTVALPLAFGIVPGDSDLAAETLDGLEPLWNQAWEGGGYGRYHCSSEPDAWGPWPFPSLFVARACVEAGRFERAWDILRWLDTIPGSMSGTWFEFYGESHSPPFAQIGLTPWTWSEMLMLLVEHILGIHPGHETLRLRPRLLPGLHRIRGSFPLRQARLEITVGRGAPSGPITVGSNAPVLQQDSTGVELAYTGENIQVDLGVR
jgi:GH15 family glucan-1,4-alpha-glucosidase